MVDVANKMMQMYLIVSLVIVHLVTLSSALYFHIGETEKKCFLEDIPDETMVVGE